MSIIGWRKRFVRLKHGERYKANEKQHGIRLLVKQDFDTCPVSIIIIVSYTNVL